MPTILVVDDDADTCRNMADLFGDLGYAIETAEGAHTALDKARQQPYDLGLLDLRMPGMDGLTLCRHLKRLQPPMVTMIVTAYGGSDLDKEARAAGAWHVLLKPVDFPAVARSGREGSGRTREIRVTPMADPLRVVILKPSKYTADGYVERFRWGFMPNSTVPYVRSMTPAELGGTQVEVHTIDEYVHTDLGYLSLLRRARGGRTLLALVGVQSHQFHRALDLAAYARRNGCMAVIGGPHVMTCDTSMLHGRGVSFALAEAELVWREILEDAAGGELRPVYGAEGRWQQELEAPVVVPPGRRDLGRYVIPMLGLYPARGCPFTCNFCSVIKIAGRRIRSQSIDTTLASLRAAKAAGVRMIMFTSDNFNKYPEAEELLAAMAKERLGLKFFVQCDTQIARQEQLVALLAKAGCFQMFVGVESFSRQTLAGGQEGTEPPGDVPRHRAAVPRAWDQLTLLEHHRLPAGHGAGCRPAPGDAARAGPDVRLLLHPLPDSRHRAVRRVHGRGAAHGGQPRPVRHDLPDMAPPQLLPRAVGRVAVSVLSQVLLVGPRGAQLDAPGLAQEWCAGRLDGETAGLPDPLHRPTTVPIFCFAW